MRAVFAGCLLAAVLVQPALGALAPHYQRQRELLAIIETHEVVEALGGAPVDSIEMVGPDVFRVRGGACSLEVRILDAKVKREPGWTGPRAFTVAPGAVSCD